MTKKITIYIAFLTGLGLISIGARFLIAPESAEIGYGIRFNEQGDYSFHYIKGIRDLFSGLLISTLVLNKQTKALAIGLLFGTLVPIADMLIVVMAKDYTDISQTVPHICAIIVCLLAGIVLLRGDKKHNRTYEGFAKIIRSANTDKESIVEFNIVPHERTPWHYHTLFTETFEVLRGSLEVGQNNDVHQLKKGDVLSIKPNEKHYFHNISDEECLVKVTVDPGNGDFQKSLSILKGLAKDGLTSTSGTPTKLSDLALFVYLNNSRMIGLQKFVEPIFNYLAKKARRKGRLNELECKYCDK